MITKKLPHPDKTVFDASEACGYLGLSWNTVKKLMDSGELRAKELRAGKRVRYLFPKENLDAYLHKDALEAKFVLQSVRGYA
jgi:excisionase family DNA binding protein